MMSENQSEKNLGLIVLAFFIVYIVWGSTYLANAWAVKAIPPFLLAGTRFTIAGLIMLLFCKLAGLSYTTKNQLRNTVYAGFFLFAVGNGLVVWALQYIDSGMAALIVALQPLVVALMMWKMKSQPPGNSTWVGIILGIIGMVILVGQPKLVSNWLGILGVLGVFVAIISWGYIAIWMTDADLPKSLFQSAGLQMLGGGIILLLIASLMGELGAFSWSNLTPKAVWSFVFLIVFGSIIAFTSFNYLILNVPPTKLVTSTYINPVVALFLGWWLNHEELNFQSMIATSFLLIGVFFINAQKNKKASVSKQPEKVA